MNTTLITLSLFGSLILSTNSYAQDVEAKVTSMRNTRGNGSIEACGTVALQDRPAWVTLTHDGAEYSTLSSTRGKWCVLFQRSTFDGKIDVAAKTLD
jgi:hypothetical protein